VETSTTKKPRPRKWKPILLVELYRLLRTGVSVEEAAECLGVARRTVYKWEAKYPEVGEMIALVRRERSQGETLKDWVYHRLSPELKELWDQVTGFDAEPGGVAKVEALLADQGRGVRQQLFLYALCETHYNPSQALKKVCVSRREFRRWLEEDSDFAELVDEIDWHKGNFFEEKLVQAAASGETAAVVFANKTYNRKRGYASKSELEVHHSGTVVHGVLDLSELVPFLSDSAKTELLEAIRRRDEAKQLRPPVPVSAEEIVDARITESVA
jgi:hypothetical protein